MSARRALAAAVVAAGMTTAACGPADEPPAPAQDGPVREQVRVGLTEWAVETGGVRAAAGEVRMVVTNTGAAAHDLVVTGEQGSWRTPVLATGERAEIAITTEPGEVLVLDCSLSGHHQQGMHTTMLVADEG